MSGRREPAGRRQPRPHLVATIVDPTTTAAREAEVHFAGREKLEVRLLGGFAVRRHGADHAIANWQRRTAKTLVKLLAVSSGHALHREEVLEALWPGSDPESALNSLGKALHAARRALEPGLLPRQGSSYVQLTDSMLILDTEQVEIDADRFEALAQEALKEPEPERLEAALAAYGGKLLPEDLYEDWCQERREHLAELHIRLLIGMGTAYARRAALGEAADRFRDALLADPTREDVHRRLMRLYVEMGTPDLAARQFHVCEDVLRRQLDLSPQAETIALYRSVLSTRGTSSPRTELPQPSLRSVPPRPQEQSLPLVGRESTLADLLERLGDRGEGPARTVIVSGEAGIGKTRLLQELATRARRTGAAVLWGGSGARAARFAYGPFSIAVEGYVASCSEHEREELAQRFPALGHLVPSLSREAVADGHDALDVIQAIVRLLTDLGRTRPVLVVLGDLNDADGLSLDLFRYLAHLAMQRPWLIAAAVREEEVDDPHLRHLIASTLHEGLCTHIELDCLSRADCAVLVRKLHPSAAVDAGVLETVYARSRGNPTFVKQVVEELSGSHAGSSLGRSRPGRSSAPMIGPAVAAMHLSIMTSTVKRVVELVSVSSGTAISLDELRRAAAALAPPIGAEELFEALDDALRTRVLEEASGGYAFRYPIVRSAVEAGIARHRRAQLLEALDEPGGAPCRDGSLQE